jgi:hypothetical protein
MKKLVNKTLLMLIFLVNFGQLFAQNIAERKCAFDQVQKNNRKSIKQFSNSMENYFQHKYVKVSLEEPEIIKIPVVVHVIHNNSARTIGGNGNSNISDAQIQSQIKVLNEDFRRTQGTNGFNANAVGADTRIEFELAKKDPKGLPTTGINRIYSAKNQYDVLDLDQQREMSKLSYWPSDCYLNIWTTTLSNGYLGYGAFPSGEKPAGIADITPEEIDGIFMDHTYFGKKTGSINSRYYNLGRTLTPRDRPLAWANTYLGR